MSYYRQLFTINSDNKMAILLALLNPFFTSLQNVLAKKNLNNENIDDLAVVFARLFYVVPVLLIFLLITGMPATLHPYFWWIVVGMAILEIPSQWFYHQAIKHGELSMVMPISTLIVLPMLTSFIFFTGWSWLGIAGVILVTVGVYTLQVTEVMKLEEPKWQKLWAPIKSMFKEKASRYMLITILFWSVTTPLQKLASSIPGQGTTPLSNIAFMGVIYLSFCSLGIILMRLVRGKKIAPIIFPKQIGQLAPIGLLSGLASVAQYWALALMNPVYVIAFKETILMWTVLWDRLVFKIKISRIQFISIIIVMLGALIVGLAMK